MGNIKKNTDKPARAKEEKAPFILKTIPKKELDKRRIPVYPYLL